MTQTGLYNHRRWLVASNFGELYSIYSKNKGADQLRSCCAADLCLCFRLRKKQVFSCLGSVISKSTQRFSTHLRPVESSISYFMGISFSLSHFSLYFKCIFIYINQTRSVKANSGGANKTFQIKSEIGYTFCHCLHKRKTTLI